MKRFQLLPLLSALGLLATACAGESDPEAKLDRFTSAESFHVISNAGMARSGLSASVMDDVRYEFAFNDDDRIVTFTIRNFKVSPDEVPADYTFTDVPWVYSVGTPDVQRIIDAVALTPATPVNAPHTFSDLHIVYYEPKKSSACENRGVVATYTVDGAYTVRAYPYVVVGEGTTVSFNTSTGESRICYSTTVSLDFDPHTLLAVMDVQGLLPDDNHRSMSFRIANVGLIFDEEGYRLSLPGTVAVDGATVSALEATASMTDLLDLKFVLTLDDGTAYNIECHLSPNLTPQSI